jgi:hypothetical protein
MTSHHPQYLDVSDTPVPGCKRCVHIKTLLDNLSTEIAHLAPPIDAGHQHVNDAATGQNDENPFYELDSILQITQTEEDKLMDHHMNRRRTLLNSMLSNEQLKPET